MAKKKKKSQNARKSQLGGVVNTALDTAASFIPGGSVGLKAAKLLGGLFNHPEWWEVVPITAPPQNVPLIGKAMGTTSASGGLPRPFWLQIQSSGGSEVPSLGRYAANIDLSVTSKYIVRDVRRKVVGIPLQSVESYRAVMSASCSIVALYLTLEKFKYLIEHPKPEFPAFQSDFPLMKAENFARLEALINRARETIRSLIKLPTTLTEYLCWRYGRVYKAGNSGKSPYVTYDYMSPAFPIDQWEVTYESQLALITDNSQASADLHKTYEGHHQCMEVPLDSQYVYDYKEHSLRLNLRVSSPTVKDLTQTTGTTANFAEVIKKAREKEAPQEDEDGQPKAPEIPTDGKEYWVCFGDVEADTVALSSTVSLYAQPIGAGITDEDLPLFPIEEPVVYSYGLNGNHYGGYTFSPTPGHDFGKTNGHVIPSYVYSSAGSNVAVSHMAYYDALATGTGLNNFQTMIGGTNPALRGTLATPLMAPYELAQVNTSTLQQFKDYQFANLTTLERTRMVSSIKKSKDEAVLQNMIDKAAESDTNT